MPRCPLRRRSNAGRGRRRLLLLARGTSETPSTMRGDATGGRRSDPFRANDSCRVAAGFVAASAPTTVDHAHSRHRARVDVPGTDGQKRDHHT